MRVSPAVIIALALAAPAAAHAQERVFLQPIGGVWRSILKAAPKIGGEGATQRDAAEGVREALALSVDEALTALSRPDGYYGEPAYRIHLPGRLGETQAALAPLGQSGALDALEQAVNRAAEAAVPRAAVELRSAVRSLDLPDAVAIVHGGDDAGTLFFRGQSEAQLRAELQPIVEEELEKAGAFSLVGPAAALAGSGPHPAKLRADTIRFATEGALAGFYAAVATGERSIRHDPSRRSSPELQAAFSAEHG